MSKLPKPTTSVGNSLGTVETTITKAEAALELDRILERNMELEEVMEALQPLLYTLSVALYGEEDDSPIPLNKLIEDACAFINGREGKQLQ
jgi:hypothetical protein